MNHTTNTTPHAREIGRMIDRKGNLIVILSDGRRVELANAGPVTKGAK